MKQLIKYGDKRFRLLKVHINKYRQNARSKSLHLIHVELKKIKALLDLLAFNSKQFNALNYKPLKHIFREAGHIRECDVLHRLFKDYELEEPEKQIIPKPRNRKQAIAEFHHKAGRHIKTVKESHNKARKYIAIVSIEGLRKYISQTEEQLNKRLFPKFKPNELHLIRKQVKELIYLSQMMDDKNNSQRIKAYDKLQNAIGKWHDKKVLIELLQKNKSTSHKAIIEKLKSNCAFDIKVIKAQVNELKPSHEIASLKNKLNKQPA